MMSFERCHLLPVAATCCNSRSDSSSCCSLPLLVATLMALTLIFCALNLHLQPVQRGVCSTPANAPQILCKVAIYSSLSAVNIKKKKRHQNFQNCITSFFQKFFFFNENCEKKTEARTKENWQEKKKSFEHNERKNCVSLVIEEESGERGLPVGRGVHEAGTRLMHKQQVLQCNSSGSKAEGHQNVAALDLWNLQRRCLGKTLWTAWIY